MYLDEEAVDTLVIGGLAAMLDDDGDVPVVTLQMRCNGRTFNVSILKAEDEWALSVREPGALHLPREDVMFPSQAEALKTAIFEVVQAGLDTV